FVERALRSRAGVVLAAPTAAEPVDVLVCSGCSNVPRDGSFAGVLLIPPQPAAPTGPTGAAAAAPMTQSSEPHPVTRALELAGTAAAIIPSTPTPTDAVIMASAGGAPALLAYDSAGRRVVELRVDLERSSLPLTPAFPVLIANAIDWLAGRDRRPTEYSAGDPIVRLVPPAAQDLASRPDAGSRGAGDTAAPQTLVTGPRQEAIPTVTDGHLVTVTSSAEAGTYRLRAGALDDVFVVNPATNSESDVSAAAGTTAVARPASTTGSTRGGTNGGQTEPTPRRDGRVDLAATVLAVALALLAAEWWLRAPQRGARPAGAGGRT
ncbi:MAG TPA: hypothetical protein VK824_11915, partial [Planctomycetota bacterium]|nr:hypothetical protein [Planctomycetota bacterium]